MQLSLLYVNLHIQRAYFLHIPLHRRNKTHYSFSRFLVPSRQRKHRKFFYCHGKYFAKENFHAPAWTSEKCDCGNKTGNPERAVSLHLAHSGSSSEHGICRILPTRRVCHIINACETLFFWARWLCSTGVDTFINAITCRWH